jgi:hypothetical protein
VRRAAKERIIPLRLFFTRSAFSTDAALRQNLAFRPVTLIHHHPMKLYNHFILPIVAGLLLLSSAAVFGQDTDNDRMTDSYETTHGLVIGTDDRYGDADGDGYPNLLEFLKSTAASNASSVPLADRIVGAGQTYTTISAALASLTAEDQLIVVKPGSYTEVVTNTTGTAKRVFIISEAVDPNLTFIRNPGTAAALVSSTKDLYLRGFTLVNQLTNSSAANHGVSLTGTGNYGIVQCIMRGHYHGIYSSPSSTARNFVDVIGCLIQDGSAYGICTNANGSTFRVVHSTLVGHAMQAVYNFASGSVFNFTNCILWGTAATQINLYYSATLTATYSCIKNPTVYAGTGNINSDPQLVQGYLGATSPCINTGVAATVPLVPEDVRGDPRVSGAAPDMGAHEYSTAASWTGDADGDGLSDALELYTYCSFIYSNDTDADRITDGYEIAQGLSILVDDRYGDADGDGFPNLAEALKGSQAGNATSVPTADRIVGAGQTYTTISAAVTSLSAEDQIIVVKPGSYTEVVTNTTGTAKRVFIISEAVERGQ